MNGDSPTPLSKDEQVTPEEVAQLIDQLRYRPVGTTAAQMRRAARVLEITEGAFQGALTDNHDLADEIERLRGIIRDRGLHRDACEFYGECRCELREFER